MRALDFKLDHSRLNDYVTPFNYCRISYVSRLFNSLSLLFPEGEKFFCESIRNYRELVPELEDEIKVFIKEEAVHSREHRKLNALLKEAGYDTDKMEAAAKQKLYLLGDTPETKLIITTCLEIFTQYGADLLLAFDKVIFKKHPVTDLWKWHAQEEAGHGHRTIAKKVLDKVYPISNVKLAAYFIMCMILLIIQTSENYAILSEF